MMEMIVSSIFPLLNLFLSQPHTHIIFSLQLFINAAMKNKKKKNVRKSKTFSNITIQYNIYSYTHIYDDMEKNPLKKTI